jgi:hypothetical protein
MGSLVDRIEAMAGANPAPVRGHAHPPSRSQRSHRDDITGDNTAAIASGLQRTGGVITSAALLLVIVIGAFSVSSITRFLSPGASRG